MTYPSSTRPEEWAQAFAVWLQREDTSFDQDSMEDWFEAAFTAASQASTQVLGGSINDDATILALARPSDGVWVSFRARTILDEKAAGPVIDELILVDVIPHGSELDALRQAVKDSGHAKFLSFGEELEP